MSLGMTSSVRRVVSRTRRRVKLIITERSMRRYLSRHPAHTANPTLQFTWAMCRRTMVDGIKYAVDELTWFRQKVAA